MKKGNIRRGDTQIHEGFYRSGFNLTQAASKPENTGLSGHALTYNNASPSPLEGEGARRAGEGFPRGFTLIELLVVVLIIGILAAVALPQYQKAVEKSRAVQAITLLKSLYQASEEYYLAQGVWPSSVDALSIQVPWSGTENWREVGDFRPGLSNEDWSIQFIPKFRGISMGRLRGKYKGTGFQIFAQKTYGSAEDAVESNGEILCVHGDSYVVAAETPNFGKYCVTIFHATRISSKTKYYRMP